MLTFIHNIFDYPHDNLLVYGSFHLGFVLLSIFIAIFASFMGFQVASQAAKNTSTISRHLSLITGSIALGGGVWAMHFIGMLSFDLCTAVEYGFVLTTISIFPAIFASWVALNLITRAKIGLLHLCIGGLLVGAGIGSMHYIGMAAMNMALLLRYDLLMFSVSILVAVVLAMLALWIRFGLDSLFRFRLSVLTKTAIASTVMGMAIAGMHYVGMAAARFVKPEGFEVSNQTSEMSAYLAIGVTLITIIISTLVMVANLALRYKNMSKIATYNEKRLIATMNTALDGIITINEKGIIESINNAVEGLFGWTSQELIGSNVRMVMPSVFHSKQSELLRDYLVDTDSVYCAIGREEVALHKNGESIPIQLGIGHVDMEGEQLYVAFISDLRQRKKMEFALRENEARFRSLIGNIPGIAFRCLDEERWPMVFISDEVENIVGFPAEDFLLPQPKRSLEDFCHPDDLHLLKNTTDQQGASFSLEYRIINQRGETKWLLEYGRLIESEDGENRWLDGFIMDISTRKEMEEQLVGAKEVAEAAAASRAAFLANMSHEIRTPMNAVIGFSDILLESMLSQEQKKYLTTINHSAKSLMHLLNDVLDSAKLDKGKIELEYRDFSLVEELDAVVSTLWLQAKNKGLEIELQFSPQLNHYYNGAPDRLRQVLTNLVGNAVKFTEKGKIVITVKPGKRCPEQKREKVEFSIQDSGIGMTPQQVEKVFEAFSQADATMSRRFGGTGLGTTISKQLVELMGGRIHATSVLNEGSTFSFNIELEPIDRLGELSDNISQDLPPLSILVVDDIEQNLELLRVLLKRSGHSTQTARDGEQALLRMQNSEFDLVLMDVQMPVLDGLSATQARRRFEHENNLSAVPIIALTASVLPEDKKAALNAGMDGFANKPINIDLLNAEMARVLNIDAVQSLRPMVEGQTDLLIDEKKGVNLWGSKTALFNEIHRFISSRNDLLAKLTEAYAQLNWPMLKQLAHGAKGVVGNLALARLVTHFDQLERHIAECNALAVKTAIDETEQLLKSIEQTLAKDLSWQTVTQSSNNPQDIAEFLLKLNAVQTMVSQNELNESLVEELQQIAPANYVSMVDHISQQLHDFEFEKALDEIGRLIALVEGDK